jgi:two-component system, cell cycle sensor histidine kinase and response regulator CckA
MNVAAQFGILPKAADSGYEQPSYDDHSMETIGRLVSGVAHDFNNLLTGIVLCSDLLLAGLDKNSNLRRYAQEVRSAAAQGASLVEQLSAAARPGKTEPTLLSFDEVVSEMRSLLRRLIGENIELRTDLADNLQLVRMSPAQGRQIVLNLALNARDAMPDGGEMTLVTRNSVFPAETLQPGPSIETPAVEFAVRDTGMGMDAHTRSRIFEPFFTTKAQGKGTGLGLATVLSIVQRHSGEIEIESEIGKGTAVTVRLPSLTIPNPTKGTET